MPTKIEKDSLTGTETTGHEWDGIKELNNPLPRWWLWVFYVSIGWSLIYWVLYPSIPGVTGYFGGLLGGNQREKLEIRMAEAEEYQAEYRTALAEASAADIEADTELLNFAFAGGRAAFADNCAPCHQLGGAGQAGGYPVLADDDWLWGGTLDAIEHTITYGVRHEPAETRFSMMPAYGETGILSRDEIDAVTGYVLSLSDAPEANATEEGEAIYTAQCAACHGMNGEGLAALGAPNLSDQVWLYGGGFADVAQQIWDPQHGVMPAFGPRLDDTTLKMLTVYVHNLGGGE
jgi:cytochrome c oxidase cbb3-type subunit 3